MNKREKATTDRKPGEPSIEVCQELALLYIQEMRKKKIEPTIEGIVKQYLISDEMAGALLAQEPSGTIGL